jgi:hypothetical protein
VGAVGTRVARQLVSSPDVSQVVLRDERRSRVATVVTSLGPTAVADDGAWTTPLVADAVVACGPAGTHAAAARAALDAGQAFVSVSDDIADVRALLELDLEARERGVSMVAGAGFSPGLTCVLAAHAASKFDAVDEIHVASVGTGGPACARQHHAALSGISVDWRDGGWSERRAGSGRELCWFPDPVGGRDCYRAAVPDALLLAPVFVGVARVTARVAATRRDRLTAGLPMMRPPHPEGGPGAVRVEVRGRRGNVHDALVFGAIDRPAVATGAVAAVTARLAVQGQLRRAGMAGLAEMADPVPFLAELRRRGVRAAAFHAAAL